MNYNLINFPIGTKAFNKDINTTYTRRKDGEYILMNKPCLSVNDVLSINEWNPVETKTSSTRKLQKLVKQKMKE